MIFYDKRNQCTSYAEFNLKTAYAFNEKEKKKRGKPSLNKDLTGIGSKKKKPMYWIGIPMNHFIKKLIDNRKELQRLFKETNDSSYQSKQKNMKLIINMIYGVTASRYFNVSNLCLGNKITGLA